MVRSASSRVSNHAAHRVADLRDAAKGPLLRACEEYRPHPEELAKQASRRMDTMHGLAAILRDAAKRPLLRMRWEIYFTPAFAGDDSFGCSPALRRAGRSAFPGPGAGGPEPSAGHRACRHHRRSSAPAPSTE